MHCEARSHPYNSNEQISKASITSGDFGSLDFRLTIQYFSQEMKNTLKFEELAQFILGIVLFSQLDLAWWWFPTLILLPDIGIFGYAINTKVGAFIYNLFHNKAIGITILLGGMFYLGETFTVIGIILFSHSAMDRIFGFGLKYPDSFKNTHLGKIGK